jgi:hypothetical protein
VRLAPAFEHGAAQRRLGVGGGRTRHNGNPRGEASGAAEAVGRS